MTSQAFVASRAEHPTTSALFRPQDTPHQDSEGHDGCIIWSGEKRGYSHQSKGGSVRLLFCRVGSDPRPICARFAVQKKKLVEGIMDGCCHCCVMTDGSSAVNGSTFGTDLNHNLSFSGRAIIFCLSFGRGNFRVDRRQVKIDPRTH